MTYVQDHHSTHISQQFNDELEQVRTELLAMGGVVERLVNDAIESLIEGDAEQAELARKNDKIVNDMELMIDEQCTRIIARRQPAAADLRLIIAISKTISDLERMGDEASRICRHAIELADDNGKGRGYQEVRHIGNLVRQMLQDCLTAFARSDAEMAYKVAKKDKSVDQEYRTAMRTLVTFMMEDPRSISNVMNVIWVLRSLERIGDHTRNMAEHLIYLVSGTDVRHSSLSDIKKTVRQHDADEKRN